MKFLLIRNDNIGDLICTTPAIQALKKAYPNAQIDIVSNSLNYCAIRQNPFIDRIFTYTKPKHKSNFIGKIGAFFGKCKTLYQIWHTKYDIAVIFRGQYSASAALFARISRAKRIIGVGDKAFITDKLKRNLNSHEVMFCVECLATLGVFYGGEKTLYTPLKKVDDFKDFVFFHISTRVEQNRLDMDKLTLIARYLKKKFNHVAITSQEPKLGKLLADATNTHYLKTSSIDELSNYMWCAKFTITLDGGVTHLAPALGVKTIAIFGKTDEKRWAPFGDEHIVISSKTGLANDILIDEIYEAVDKI